MKLEHKKRYSVIITVLIGAAFAATLILAVVATAVSDFKAEMVTLYQRKR
jgi:hypothetical protein